MRPRTPSGAAALALAGLFALAVLAGCTSGSSGKNQAPVADLKVSKDSGWTGDDFTFDAQDSKDPDGHITNYRLDFGDGTPAADASNENDARVTHNYVRGGQFSVTLTVTDDGKDGSGALVDSDSVQVTVDERVQVAGTAVSVVPGNDTGAKQDVPFKVYEKANRFEANLTLRSALVTGSSSFTVRILDPSGGTIAEKSVSVGPGTAGQTITLDGLLTKQGEHQVEVEATSGGGTADGEVRIIYGEATPS
jgi:hypothetical protein